MSKADVCTKMGVVGSISFISYAKVVVVDNISTVLSGHNNYLKSSFTYGVSNVEVQPHKNMDNALIVYADTKLLSTYTGEKFRKAYLVDTIHSKNYSETENPEASYGDQYAVANGSVILNKEDLTAVQSKDADAEHTSNSANPYLADPLGKVLGKVTAKSTPNDFDVHVKSDTKDPEPEYGLTGTSYVNASPNKESSQTDTNVAVDEGEEYQMSTDGHALLK